MDSVLRPRDIQARIRSGESPEAVAVAAQTSVDRIMGYATPVLAERAYVAQQAQRASVRRRAGDGPIGPLADAVAGRLGSRELDPDSVAWDAWRREDGRWTVVADYACGASTERARFVFDVAGRYVIAEDDQARWLVSERPAPDPSRQERAAEDPPGGRRLASVREEQLPLGDDAIALVTGRTGSTDDDTGRDTGRGAERGADWIATQASDRPNPSAPPSVEQEPVDALFDTTELAGPAAGAGEPPFPGPDGDTEDPGSRPAKPARPRGRASVPSWDEIMFGSNQKD